MKRSVLFVCLGNICRSPMAEAIFTDLVKKRNLVDQWNIGSRGIIDFHNGKGPDSRAISMLEKHGISDYQHKALQISSEDFRSFDYVFGMDVDNISDLTGLSRMVQSKKSKIDLLGRYDPDGEIIIPDPYYSENIQAFELVYQQCLRSCEGFLKSFE